MEPNVASRVYVITEGSYSDYHIVAIFSTREEADRMVALGVGDEVEEYTLDMLPKSLEFGPVYSAIIDMESGDLTINGLISENVPRHPSSCDARWIFKDKMTFRERMDRDWRDHLIAIEVKSPISSDHAAKVAVENRQGELRTRNMIRR